MEVTLSYDHLEGDWRLFYKVARGFVRRVKPEDRQDFLHDLMLAMAKVKARYDLMGKPLTEGGLIRIATYEVADYWRRWFMHTNGLECGRCGKVQRHKCHEEHSHHKCSKAIKLESLDRLVEGSYGDKVELHQMIADGNAIDLVARLDAKNTLNGYPHRFVQLAY